MSLIPPKKPCGSCPYDRSTPSGIWSEEEYRKLIEYDNETPFQPMSVFMCHQHDGHLCGGWIMTHDVRHLLSLRLTRVHQSVFDYKPKGVRVYSSGKEAYEYGIKDIDNPSEQAIKKMDTIIKVRGL